MKFKETGKKMPTRSMNVQNHTRVVPSVTINMQTGEVTYKKSVGGTRGNKNMPMIKR